MDNNIGFQVWHDLNDDWSFGFGAISVDREGEASYDDLFSRAYLIAEADYNVELGDQPGTYRFYVWHYSFALDEHTGNDTTSPTGFGISFDQQFANHYTAFLRLGFGDDSVQEVALDASAGLQIGGSAYGRETDTIGLGLALSAISDDWKDSQTTPSNFDDELFMEVYYRSEISDHIAVSAHIQHAVNPAGQKNTDDITAFALRGH